MAAESWPWGCLSRRSASGTETRAASRGSGAGAGGRGAGTGAGGRGGGKGPGSEPAGPAWAPSLRPPRQAVWAGEGWATAMNLLQPRQQREGGGRRTRAPRSLRMGLEGAQGGTP